MYVRMYAHSHVYLCTHTYTRSMCARTLTPACAHPCVFTPTLTPTHTHILVLTHREIFHHRGQAPEQIQCNLVPQTLSK